MRNWLAGLIITFSVLGSLEAMAQGFKCVSTGYEPVSEKEIKKLWKDNKEDVLLQIPDMTYIQYKNMINYEHEKFFTKIYYFDVLNQTVSWTNGIDMNEVNLGVTVENLYFIDERKWMVFDKLDKFLTVYAWEDIWKPYNEQPKYEKWPRYHSNKYYEARKTNQVANLIDSSYKCKEYGI